MATKYILVLADGSKTTVSKKAIAIRKGEESGLLFQVWTTPGEKMVHDTVNVPDNGSESDSPEPVQEVLFTEHIDFPGNYSTTLAPLAVQFAEVAGVSAEKERIPGKLDIRVHLGGVNQDKVARVRNLISDAYAEALDVLHRWQKENIEQRRGLTDMQKYTQHRNVLRKHFSYVIEEFRSHPGTAR